MNSPRIWFFTLFYIKHISYSLNYKIYFWIHRSRHTMPPYFCQVTWKSKGNKKKYIGNFAQFVHRLYTRLLLSKKWLSSYEWGIIPRKKIITTFCEYAHLHRMLFITRFHEILAASVALRVRVSPRKQKVGYPVRIPAATHRCH